MVRRTKHNPIFWLFVLPVLLVFILVIVIPFILGMYYSFTDWTASARADESLKWVNFDNYTQSFHDIRFIYSFVVTTVYTLLNIVMVNIAAFFMALLVSSNIKGRNIYRAGFFLPNLIGGLVLGFIWQFIMNRFIPAAEIAVGLGHLAQPEHLLLNNGYTAVLAMVLVGTWQSAGYIMMIYLASIQSIPVELLEAAKIDGASPFQRLRAITIPMIANAFTITTFLTLVGSFKQFDVNVSLTRGGPSVMFNDQAINGTELLAMNIYNTAFNNNKLAQGQARAVIFFLVLTIFSIAQVVLNKKKEIEQ